MRAFIAFTKKEFIESVRTYKLFIIFAVFLLFGMLNPIMAKILPEILSSITPSGISITLAVATPLDSWIQFYKNMSGMLIIVFVIVYSGAIATELSRGTLVNMLTKGLSRKTVILSKFTSTTLIWTIGYLICFGTTLAYTVYLLPGELPNIMFAAFCMWLFGVLIISIMLFGGILFGNIYGSLLVTGGFAALLMLLNIVEKMQKFNPYLLSTGNIPLLTSSMAVSDFTAAIATSIIIIFIALIGGIISFNKKQL